MIEDTEANSDIEGKPPMSFYLTRYQAEKTVVLQKLQELGHQA